MYFSDIITLFDNKSDRTVEKLKLAYNDKELMGKLIRGLFEKRNIINEIKEKKVLLKPNWVLHNRKEADEICLRTHDNFLLAAIEVIVSYKPKTVLVADAPVQGCRWSEIIRPEFVEEVDRLSSEFEVEIRIKDFRRVTFDPKLNNLTIERNPIENYVIFDLAEKSYLEPISDNSQPLFRVTDYNPDRLVESHAPGKHKYCIAKEVFEYDTIITLPKVKTHQKAGLTNALKILVGINGDKDYLPHHRKGGAEAGGDCYPGKNILLKISEEISDSANRRRGKKVYKLLRYLSLIFWKISFPTPKHNLAAAWYGNDTTWRMTLDLNKIAELGTREGTIADVPQRVLYSLSDGIIGGQGDGPLVPDPLPLGIICFSNLSSLTDAAMANLMDFDIKKIPLVDKALEMDHNKSMELTLNGEVVTLGQLKDLSIKTTPPPGWVEYFNN